MVDEANPNSFGKDICEPGKVGDDLTIVVDPGIGVRLSRNLAVNFSKSRAPLRDDIEHPIEMTREVLPVAESDLAVRSREELEESFDGDVDNRRRHRDGEVDDVDPEADYFDAPTIELFRVAPGAENVVPEDKKSNLPIRM